MEQQNHGNQGSAGLSSEETVLSGLSHLAVLLSWWGLIGVVVLYFIYKPKSQFVAQHAKQAAGFNLILSLIIWIFGSIFGVGVVGVGLTGGNPFAFVGAAALFGLIMSVIGLAGLVMGIIASIQGFKGQEYRYPIIGDMVHKINI